MTTSRLADRLRGIIKSPGPGGPGRLGSRSSWPALPPPEGPGLQEILGGQWRESVDGRSFVVEGRIAPDTRRGRVSVGELAETHERASALAPILAGAPARPPFVFVDLETTGLSGGAGTLAFLIGCGWFDDAGAFVTRQHLLIRFSDERAMLGAAARDLVRAGALVSFNGKAFDVPVLETRYLFHRLEWWGEAMPHVDVLHPSRQFWGRGGPLTPTRRLQPGAGSNAGQECSLASLERLVLGLRRGDDVPGFEIPTRYFQFVRSGDARLLAAVLEHNRHDLLAVAGLSARLLDLVAAGPVQAREAGEALALGRLYTRAGLDSRATEAFERVLALVNTPARSVAVSERPALGASHVPLASDSSITVFKIAALGALARAARREREYEDAAARWRELLDVPGCPRRPAREASQALAIHHEHRAGDLVSAKAFALRSLDREARPTWNDAVRHRLARIQRKIARAEQNGQLGY